MGSLLETALSCHKTNSCRPNFMSPNIIKQLLLTLGCVIHRIEFPGLDPLQTHFWAVYVVTP